MKQCTSYSFHKVTRVINHVQRNVKLLFSELVNLNAYGNFYMKVNLFNINLNRINIKIMDLTNYLFH